MDAPLRTDAVVIPDDAGHTLRIAHGPPARLAMRGGQGAALAPLLETVKQTIAVSHEFFSLVLLVECRGECCHNDAITTVGRERGAVGVREGGLPATTA